MVLTTTRPPSKTDATADAEATSVRPDQVQRGPLRPERLSPSRDRLSGAALVRGLQMLDVAAMVLAGVAVILLNHLISPDAALPILVLPCAAGILACLWSIRRFNAYAFRPSEALGSHIVPLISGAIVGTAVMRILCLMLKATPVNFSASWWGATTAALLAVHVAAYAWIRRMRRLGRLTPNIVIVGATESAGVLIRQALAAHHVHVLGIFDDRSDRIPKDIEGVPVLGRTAAIADHKILPYIDRIVLAVPPTAQARIGQLVDQLRLLPNPVTLFVDEGPDTTGSVIRRLADAPLAEQGGPHLDMPGAVAKRLLDIVLSVLGLILVGPLMLVTAILVRLESPGPVLFRQQRHGFNNETITVLKFRSMQHDPLDATSQQQVQPDDIRVTRLGKFIRHTSFDELPQLLNVLIGEMSLVGPRPHAVGMKSGDTETARLVAEYAWRHRMKPGITGWAQINGSRGPVDTPEAVRRRVALDIEYIERQSLWFDLYIIAMTVPRLFGDGEAVR